MRITSRCSTFGRLRTRHIRAFYSERAAKTVTSRHTRSAGASISILQRNSFTVVYSSYLRLYTTFT
jgi:hypothetical protein